MATPIVFDWAGNHPGDTRNVVVLTGCDTRGVPEMSVVRQMPEEKFRKVLGRAIRSDAYPAATVDKLRVDEPWLAGELGGDWRDAERSGKFGGVR